MHASLREAMHLGRERFGFRLVHYSIQEDHLHLISEANDRRALSRGMQGLGIRMAKGVNRQLGVRGKVFADRYHVRALRTPREVRHALAYVLNNRRRHLAKRGRAPRRAWFDPLSSSAFFDGWREPVVTHPDDLEAPPVVPATVWLLTTGWRRHGPIPIDETPGAG